MSSKMNMKMTAFIGHVLLQFKMDFRERSMLVTFYLIPLVFFVVMGAVFSSINPMMKATLAATMSLFAVTMGAVLGIPSPLVKMREEGTFRAWRVNAIPGPALLIVQGLSAFLHLAIVSIIITITAPMLYGAEAPRSILAYIGIMFLFLLASIAIGLLIGVAARNNATAIMLSQLVFLPSLLLGGMMFPSSLLSEPLMWVGRILPATHALQAMTGAAYDLPAELAPVVSIFALIGIFLVVSILTVAKFRTINQIK